MPFSFSSVHRGQPHLGLCSFLPCFRCFRCFGRVFVWTCSVWSCGVCVFIERMNTFSFVFNASKLRCSNYRYFLRHSHSLLAAHCFDRVERTMPLIAYWDVWILQRAHVCGVRVRGACVRINRKFHSKFKNEDEAIFALRAETPYHLLNYSQHHHRPSSSSALVHEWNAGCNPSRIEQILVCDSKRQRFVSSLFFFFTSSRVRMIGTHRL